MAASSSSLSLFWELASPSEDKRIQSSSSLVSSLVAQQSGIVATTSRTTLDESDDAALEAHLDRALAADVSYSLKRLIRGLASPREQSRIGFAVALTELLSQLQAVLHPRDVLFLIQKHSTAQGKVSRSEERNLLFARLFGLQALLRSGLLLNHTDARVGEVTQIISLLDQLAKTKAWLTESAGWVINELLDETLRRCQNSQLRDQVLQQIEDYAISGDLTSEKIALHLRLPGDAPRRIHPSLIEGDVLSSSNLAIVAKVLRNATAISLDKDDAQEAKETSKDGSGAHNPKVHFVWDAILQAYFGENTIQTSAKSRAAFADFYRTAVDESLFAAQASPERKSWGFQVFSKALPLLPASDKPLLFTPNFMRTWINQLSEKNRLLHKAASNAAAVVQSTVKENPRAGFALVAQLLGKHGSQNFDRLTNTKTIEGLLASMDAQGVRDYVEWIVQTIASSTETAKRRWGLDQLLVLIRNTAVPTDDKCCEQILEYLTAGAFLSWKKAPKAGLLSHHPKPSFNDEVRSLFRSRLLSCLTDLVERSTTVDSIAAGASTQAEIKARRMQGVTSKGEPWLRKAWEILRSLSNNTKEFSLAIPEEVQAGTVQASKLLQKLHKSASDKNGPLTEERRSSFEQLIIASLLYAYDSPQEDIGELTEQLGDCFGLLFEGRAAEAANVEKSLDSADDDEEGEDISGVELLLDYLVGLLERPSAFLRAVAEQVFATFCTDMNLKSIDHLVDQLGLNEEPSDEDASNDDEEMADGDEDGSSETSSDSASSAEDDSEEDGVDVDVVLRDQVFQALKAGGMADVDADEADSEAEVDDAVIKGAEAGAGDGEDTDSDDVESLPDLTDEQMLQIDDRLADIFRSRLGGRKNTKEAKQESIAFQNKILDLLAIFSRKSPSSPLVLRIVRPLFVLATESDDDSKQVASKAANVLRSNICKNRELPDEVDVDAVVEDLEAIHGFARRTSSSDLSSMASTVNLYLTRACLGDNASEMISDRAPLVKLYNETLDDFLTRNASQLKGSFLIDAFKRVPVLGWEVRSKLFEGCSLTASIKAFRQQQAMQMLSTVLNQLSQSKSVEDASRLSKLLPDVAEVVFSSLAAATTNASAENGKSSSDNVNANKLKEVLKLGLQAVRLSHKASPSNVKAIWKPTKIKDFADGLSKSERFQQSTSLQGMLKQMISIVEGGSSANKAEKKRKDRENATVEAGSAKVTSGGALSAAAKKQKKMAAAPAEPNGIHKKAKTGRRSK